MKISTAVLLLRYCSQIPYLILSQTVLVEYEDGDSDNITTTTYTPTTSDFEPEDDTVPIIVGSCLSVIVLGVLIWYIVQRYRGIHVWFISWNKVIVYIL